MKMFRTALFTLLVSGGFAASVVAQGMFGGAGRQSLMGGIGGLFGKDKAFTATAQMSVKDGSGNALQSMDLTMAVLDGKVRTEMDMTKMQASQMPPAAIEHIRQMGMDRTVHITIPDQHLMYMLYPGMKAYAIMQTPADSAGAQGAPPKIERTEIGPETIDGHPCIKTKVVTTTSDGQAVTSYLWEAKDLDGYPVQTQTVTPEGMTITYHLQNINKAKPDASLFAPPADYTRYNSMQELMMSRMGGMMGGMPAGMPPHGGGGQ